jgi:hypothetical protein
VKVNELYLKFRLFLSFVMKYPTKFYLDLPNIIKSELCLHYKKTSQLCDTIKNENSSIRKECYNVQIYDEFLMF